MLIVWEVLDLLRIVIRNPNALLDPLEAKNEKLYRDEESGVEVEVVDHVAFVEWIVQNYENFGTQLEFVSDRSEEGNQFCKGFGGVGGLMWYRVELEMFDEPDIVRTATRASMKPVGDVAVEL